MERHTETIRREVAEVHKEGDVDVESKGGVEVRSESDTDRSRRRTR